MNIEVRDNLRHGAFGWTLHENQIKELLGLKPSSHLPDDGLPPQMIGNVLVWIIGKPLARALATELKRKFVHRVYCECPKCHTAVPAGRLHQHLGTKVCNEMRGHRVGL